MNVFPNHSTHLLMCMLSRPSGEDRVGEVYVSMANYVDL
jgi:hypothetical protein